MSAASELADLLAAERAHADDLAEALRFVGCDWEEEQTERFNLRRREVYDAALAKHDRMREAER